MRIKQVDDYMEWKFGKPDFDNTFFHPESGMWRTPMGDGKIKIWRVDLVKPKEEVIQ